MPWPAMHEYAEALQYPRLCFEDDRVRDGSVRLNKLKMPCIVCGQFAGVCRVENSQSNTWAVRFFQSNRAGIRDRYQIISAHLAAHRSPIFANFEYIDRGIRVGRDWYPILLMEWVDGEPLLGYVTGLVRSGNRNGLTELAERWIAMLQELQCLKIAHGDLQHGNIKVMSDGTLRLIDYDGMWVPALTGQPGLESGLPDYQHPRRLERDFGPDLDLFAGLTVYVALRALALDPTLWPSDPGIEYIVLRASDYKDPATSRVFKRIKKIAAGDPDLQSLAEKLIEWCGQSHMPAIPWLPPKDPYLNTLAEVEKAIDAGDWVLAERIWTDRGLDKTTPPPQHQAQYDTLLTRMAQHRARREKAAALTKFVKAVSERDYSVAVDIWRKQDLDSYPGAAQHKSQYEAAVAQLALMQLRQLARTPGKEQEAVDLWDQSGPLVPRFATNNDKATYDALKRRLESRRHLSIVQKALAQKRWTEAVKAWDEGRLGTFAEAEPYGDEVARARKLAARTTFLSLYYAQRWTEAVKVWELNKLSTLSEAANYTQLYENAQRKMKDG